MRALQTGLEELPPPGGLGVEPLGGQRRERGFDRAELAERELGFAEQQVAAGNCVLSPRVRPGVDVYWEKPNHRMHVGCVALLHGPIPSTSRPGVPGWKPIRRSTCAAISATLPYRRRDTSASCASSRTLSSRRGSIPYVIDGRAGGRAALLCKVTTR